MKLQLLVLYLFAFIMSHPASAQITSVGLVAYYPFNTNAVDSTGHGHDGVVNGATLTADRFGIANHAYYFDGVDDYIVVNNVSAFANNNYTYSWWVRPDSVLYGYASVMIESGSDNFGGPPAQVFSINNNYLGTLGWRITSGNSNNTNVAFQTNQLPPMHQWYHLAITRDNAMVRLFVNGVETDSVSTAGQLAYYYSPLDMYIGSRAQLNLPQYLNGAMDDIRVYNRALNNSEIAEMVTGINDNIITKMTLNIYPNPSDGIFRIPNVKVLSVSTFMIFDESGKMVFNDFAKKYLDNEDLVFDLTPFESGSYFISICSDHGEFSGQVVLQ